MGISRVTPGAPILTGAELRRRYRSVSSRLRARPAVAAVVMFAASLATVCAAPAFADGPDTYRLQGQDLSEEFVHPPFVLAAGRLNGRHVNLESGLLGTTSAAGQPGTAYCMDASTHRRHDAGYHQGGRVDVAGQAKAAPILWLLRNAFPNGPPLLGGDPSGLARSGSVVQAAIWHFSDGFDLDPAGQPYVDAAYRRAYELLLNSAALAPPPAAPSLRLEPPPMPVDLDSLAGDRGIEVVLRATGADGLAVPDGTPLEVDSDAPGIGTSPGQASAHPASDPLRVPTTGGKAIVRLAVTPAVNGSVTIHARIQTRSAPGWLLTSSVPTQRLVDASWGMETLEVHARVDYVAHAHASMTKAVRNLSAVGPGPRLTDAQLQVIDAHPGDHLRFELTCVNHGLIPYAGEIVDDFRDPRNHGMDGLRNVHVAPGASSEVAPEVLPGGAGLRWMVVSGSPADHCGAAFDAEVPVQTPGGEQVVNCAYLKITGPEELRVDSNCVRVRVNAAAPLSLPAVPRPAVVPVMVAVGPTPQPPQQAVPPVPVTANAPAPPAATVMAKPTPSLPATGHPLQPRLMFSALLGIAGCLLLVLARRGDC